MSYLTNIALIKEEGFIDSFDDQIAEIFKDKASAEKVFMDTAVYNLKPHPLKLLNPLNYLILVLSIISLSIAFISSKIGKAGYWFNAIIAAPFELLIALLDSFASFKTQVYRPLKTLKQDSPKDFTAIALFSLIITTAAITLTAIYAMPAITLAASAIASTVALGSVAILPLVISILLVGVIGLASGVMALSVGKIVRENVKQVEYSVSADVFGVKAYGEGSPLYFERTDYPKEQAAVDQVGERQAISADAFKTQGAEMGVRDSEGSKANGLSARGGDPARQEKQKQTPHAREQSR